MKTLPFKLSTILFMLLYFLSFQGMAKKADISKTKTISKTIKVNPNHELEIDNKFGEVKITTWDKNEVQVKITISVTTNNEKKTAERLDNIDVKIEESASNSKFKTYFLNEKKNNNNGKSDMSIDYEVKMPKSNSLDVSNSFGAFIINDIDGRAKIEVKFGSARIGKITHPDSRLRFDFSDPVEISHLEHTAITAKYSKLKLTAATEVKLISEFSNTEILGIGKLDAEIKFGSINIKQAIKVMIKSNMASVEIEELLEEGDFKPKYGSLTIDLFKKSMTRLVVDGEFSPIDIEIEEGASFNAEISGSMASIKVPSDGWSEKEKDMNTKSFKGSFGQASENKVRITSSFGSVKLDF